MRLEISPLFLRAPAGPGRGAPAEVPGRAPRARTNPARRESSYISRRQAAHPRRCRRIDRSSASDSVPSTCSGSRSRTAHTSSRMSSDMASRSRIRAVLILVLAVPTGMPSSSATSALGLAAEVGELQRRPLLGARACHGAAWPDRRGRPWPPTPRARRPGRLLGACPRPPASGPPRRGGATSRSRGTGP